ncbi:DHHC palmitoyltransferase-domain-containing protein [Chlamydoabsidia padenii]|nr:DHHC palmitoyltransferase-domain-containing protein [Chlamydoabsidia padenii]
MSSTLDQFIATCLFPGIVTGLMASSLYIFYYQFCEPLLLDQDTKWNGMILTFMAISLWCMSMLCYLQILCISPGSPHKIDPSSATKPSTPPQLISVCQENGKLRYCQPCKSIKPERSHHCRVCNVCVLRMDHHCSWINGCVGYHNHKIFFLFLLYTLLYLIMLFYYCLLVILESISIKPCSSFLKLVWTMYKIYFIALWTVVWNLWQNAWNRKWVPVLTGASTMNITIKYQIILMAYISFIFCVFLAGLTLIQGYLILRNRTTLEHIASHEQFIRLLDLTDEKGEHSQVICLHPPERRLYDIGIWKNWKSVMGDDWYLWWCKF